MSNNIGVLALAVLVGAGASFAAERFLPPEEEVVIYGKPIGYSVARDGPKITYSAVGERLQPCEHLAPLQASLKNAWGVEVDRALMRRASGEIIEDMDVPKPPRSFSAVGLFFVSHKTGTSNEFSVIARCFDDSYGIVEGKFGPFPVPEDGQTIRFPALGT